MTAKDKKFQDAINAKVADAIDARLSKADAGKLRISLVPTGIIREIARVRMYGTKKYHDPENWKKVEKERYRDAMLRHILAYIDNPDGVDEESGLPHLSHVACNVAFLIELDMTGRNKG